MIGLDFSRAVETGISFIQQNFAVACCLIVLGQAYMPHGAVMKDYVGDMMDQLEEMFRSRKKGGDNDDEEDDHQLLLTSYSDPSFNHSKVMRVNGIDYIL